MVCNFNNGGKFMYNDPQATRISQWDFFKKKLEKL